jgi:hypothetical protein
MAEQRTAKPAPKTADRELLTDAHRAWRTAVLKRAGWRCEVIAHGERCANRHPQHVMYADHRVERQDGGALHDVSNGTCLCASHHTLKTNIERAKRIAAPLK